MAAEQSQRQGKRQRGVSYLSVIFKDVGGGRKVRDDLLTVWAPCGKGGQNVARAGEAAEPGAPPGTDRETFPGASLHPTDCGGGGSSDSYPLHTTLSGSCVNSAPQTLSCVSAVSTRAL